MQRQRQTDIKDGRPMLHTTVYIAKKKRRKRKDLNNTSLAKHVENGAMTRNYLSTPSTFITGHHGKQQL